MRERKQKNHLLLSIIAFVGLLMLIVTSQIYCRNTPEPTDPPILELTETPTTEQTESPTVNPATEPPVTDPTETNSPSTGIPVTDSPKTGTEYDKNAKGRITFTVKVPEGFDEVVIVSLMDTNGGGPLFPVLPESNYVLVENLPSGLYYVSAYVENDPRMEYIVLRDCDEITVSQEQDAFMNFTVTGGPKEDTESTTAPTDPPVTEPPATAPPQLNPLNLLTRTAILKLSSAPPATKAVTPSIPAAAASPIRTVRPLLWATTIWKLL